MYTPPLSLVHRKCKINRQDDRRIGQALVGTCVWHNTRCPPQHACDLYYYIIIKGVRSRRGVVHTAGDDDRNEVNK